MSAKQAEPESGFPIGPVQLLVLVFVDDTFSGKILPELRRLRDLDVVRLVDLLVVRKSDAGDIESAQVSDLEPEEAEAFGTLIGALVGFGTGDPDEVERGAAAGAAEGADGHLLDDDAVWYLADAIPNGSAAAIALIEHRWAIGTREAIRAAGGVSVTDAWVHPADLAAAGLNDV